MRTAEPFVAVVLVCLSLTLPGVARSAQELPGPWRVTAGSNPAAAGFAVDGNPETAWRSVGPQRVAERLEIDLGQPRVVQQVRITTASGYPTDFARGVAVLVSRDGRAFTEIARASTLNAPELRLRFNPVPARFVQVQLTDSSGYRWAVAEIDIRGAPGTEALDARNAVVVAADAPALVRLAAEDLRDCLGAATGRYLSLVTDQDLERVPGTKYAVGRNILTNPCLADIRGRGPESILLRKTGDTVIMLGATPRASAYAAYRLLHRLGVRWYTPGENGEHIPQLDTIDLEGLNLVHEPAIPVRWMSSVRASHIAEDSTWALRNCLSYVTESAMHYFHEHTGVEWPKPAMLDWPYGFYPHNLQRMIPAATLERHPELMPMVDGTRRPYQGASDNFCTSAPAAVELVSAQILAWFRAHPRSRSFPICPQDAGVWCECPRCQALDEPLRLENFSRKDMRDVSDRFFTFVNAVAQRVTAEFPDRTITTIAYANWHQAPRFDLHPAVLVNVCQYGCSAHAANDPKCERNHEMARRMLEWRERATLLGVYDYVLLNSRTPAEPRTPHPYGRSVPEELRWLAQDLKIVSWWSESAGAFWQWSPAPFWLAMQMAWDADQDHEALLQGLYADYYGPAAGPARQYWTLLERRVHEDGVHMGSYNNRPAPEMFTPELLTELDAAVTAAAQAAGANDRVAPHVTRLRESLAFVRERLAQEAAEE